MGAISDLPTLYDMDADYSPQYVKLARVLRDKIKAGEIKHAEMLPASGIAAEYQVSIRVVYAALEMLAANTYIARARRFQPYTVTT